MRNIRFVDIWFRFFLAYTVNQVYSLCFVFDSYKIVSQNLTSLVLTLGKWSIFLVKVKAKVLVLTTTLFFFRNFYIFLVYINLIVNRNSYVMKIKTKRSTWYRLKIYRISWGKKESGCQENYLSYNFYY